MTTKNKARGYTTIKINGQSYKLCVTLGVLADIEAKYGGINKIDEKLANPSILDLMFILSCLLEGGDNYMDIQDLRKANISFGDVVKSIQECFQAAGLEDDSKEASAKGKK